MPKQITRTIKVSEVRRFAPDRITNNTDVDHIVLIATSMNFQISHE